MTIYNMMYQNSAFSMVDWNAYFKLPVGEIGKDAVVKGNDKLLIKHIICARPLRKFRITCYGKHATA